MSILGGAAGFAGGLAGGLIGQAVSGVSAPFMRAVEQTSNARSPNVPPAPGDLIRALNSQRISESLGRKLLCVHGANFLGIPPYQLYGKAWQAVRETYRPQLDGDALSRLQALGVLGPAGVYAGLIRLGYDMDEIGPALLQLLHRPPTFGQTMGLLWRGLIPLPQATALVQDATRCHFELTPRLMSAAEFVPPVTDLIRFMMRDTGDPNIVGPEKLDDEFPQKWQRELRTWTKWQGVPEEVMLHYWRAHYIYPSPTQSYEMLHRLRPGRQFLLPPDLRGTPPVVLADVRRLLAINDYAPLWRDRLAAISYHPINRTDLLQMIGYGLIGEVEAIERFKDLGFAPVDAELQAALGKRQQTERRLKSAYVLARGEIQALYRDGVIDDGQLAQMLDEMGLTAEERQAASARVRLLVRHDGVKAVIRSVRQLLYDGVYDEQMARNTLAEAGVNPRAREQYVQRWRLEIVSGRRFISARKAIQIYSQNLMTAAELNGRLIRLGYDGDDIGTLMVDAERMRQQTILRQLERVRRQQEQLANKARAALARTSSRSQVIRWWRDGRISTEDAETRLLALGIDPADVPRYLS